MIRYNYSGLGIDAWQGKIAGYDPNFLVELFRRMLRIRLIEEEIERRYRQDHMKTPIHLVIGQEATAVGCCSAMRISDLVYSSHRTHGVYLAKGGSLKGMLSEMHCRIDGCAASRGGSMHLIDFSVGMAGTSAIVGGSVPIATGAALAAKMQGADRAIAVFFGEAASEEGVVSECLNFAALKKLPIVFFCENNFYSVQSPLFERQPDRDLTRWAEAHALTAARVDGMNVLEVHQAANEAFARARSGAGPSFIEARVYRYRAHGGNGDDSATGYRDVAEREAWGKLCPVEGFYGLLRGAGILDDARRKAMHEAIVAETIGAFEHALAAPHPVEADLYTHVYAD
ncbi:MAG: thiamine pyrophosphate-dependent dehydrogenase E1 component subunit alpha [Betaproteobacteria bacterium]|nr:thiamine pyrophosphate-dependent dehydrogenase E1 component subunit alpha [Betaproteobacteria bacterium]